MNNEEFGYLNGHSRLCGSDDFRIFMDKMNLAEKFVQENGYYSEEEAKAVLDKVYREEKLRGVATDE